jgi:transporter family-2 protein
VSTIWFYPFIIVAGVLQAFGAVMSAQLRVSLTNPWLAATVAFVLNAFFFASLIAVLHRPLPTLEGSRRVAFQSAGDQSATEDLGADEVEFLTVL